MICLRFPIIPPNTEDGILDLAMCMVDPGPSHIATMSDLLVRIPMNTVAKLIVAGRAVKSSRPNPSFILNSDSWTQKQRKKLLATLCSAVSPASSLVICI